MTNTGWQQSSPVRRPLQTYFADGDEATVLDPSPDDEEDSNAVDQEVQLNAARGPVTVPPPAAPAEPGPAQVGYPDNSGDDAGSAAPPRVAPATPPTFDTSEYQRTMDALRAKIAQQPVAHKPNWLERIAAGALGGAVGWTNAAGRIKHPIDPSQGIENILHPGYQQNMEAWKSEIAPLEAQAQLAGQQLTSQQNIAKTQAQIDRERAQSLYYEGLGRTAPMVEVTPEMSAVSGGMFHVGQKIPASTATAMAQIAAGRYQPQEKTIVVTDPKFAEKMHVAVGTAVPYSVYQAGINRENAPARNKTEWESYLDAAGGDAQKALKMKQDHDIAVAQGRRDPEVDEERQRKALEAVGQRKSANENAIQARRTQEINQTLQRMGYTGSYDDAMKLPAGNQYHDAMVGINRKYAPMLVNNQQNYINASRNRGIDTSDSEYHINPDTLEYTLRTPAAPAAAVAPAFVAIGPDGSTQVSFPTQASRDAFLKKYPTAKAQ